MTSGAELKHPFHLNVNFIVKLLWCGMRNCLVMFGDPVMSLR